MERFLVGLLVGLSFVSTAFAEVGNVDITVDESHRKSNGYVCLEVNVEQRELWDGCYEILTSFKEINLAKGPEVRDEAWALTPSYNALLSGEWQREVSTYQYSRVKHLAFNWKLARVIDGTIGIPFYVRYQFKRTKIDQGTHIVVGLARLRNRTGGGSEVILQFYDESSQLEEIGQVLMGILFENDQQNGEMAATAEDVARLNAVVVPTLERSLNTNLEFMMSLEKVSEQRLQKP